YTIVADVTKQMGRHLMKFGTRLSEDRSTVINTGYWYGNFSFTPAWTQRNPLSADTTSGSDMPSFLLGYPASGHPNSKPSASVRNKLAGLYYQDDIRISSKLSINLGLRWDVQTAPTERYNRDVYTFDTTASYPLGNAQATGELQFANGSRRAPWNTKWRDF